MLIRPEEGRDRDVIAAVHESAFRGPEEARLVGLLRNAGKAEIALVAVDVAVDVNGDDRVVGHVVFSPVAVERSPGGAKVLGLGPVGVLPAYQRQGVGRAPDRTGARDLRGERLRCGRRAGGSGVL